MLRSTLSVAVLLGALLAVTTGQENAQLQIPPSLIECYNTSDFMNRDNRVPATIDSLIALIEKVENTYGYNQDMRQTAVSLLHRFRQDGIQRAPGVVASDNVIPYSPTGFQFSKFRILLSRLIPGNAFNFPNETLSRAERCSLHFMLSSSFELWQRGDENSVCNQLSQYRAQRIPRSMRSTAALNSLRDDVEVLESVRRRAASMQLGPNSNSNGNSNSNTNAKNYDIETSWSQTEFGYNLNDVSACPVENGVIWTPWGSVAAGTLIAGIAAGLQQQNVQLRTLLALARRHGVSNLPQTTTVSVDNRWAATLAGDLAEVALVQLPESQTGEANVGANGGWNSTVLPKWYFLSQRQNLEMTDAEIRGGLDGLILAMNVASWRTQVPGMKLSQLLRMYYSMEGVLGSGIMACNRKENFPNVAPAATMTAQTTAFAQILNLEMSLKVTLEQPAIAKFSTSASNALISYVPQYMNDVSCSVSSSLPSKPTDSVTPMTNIYVFLDFTWRYEDIVEYLMYILQRLNIGPYGSSVSLVAASDGTIVVNRTNHLDEIYRNWNVSTHSRYNTGFDLPTIMRHAMNMSQALMNEQKTNNTAGGHSLVALLMPYMQQMSESDSTYAESQRQLCSELVPDLYFLYYGGGNINRFESFVEHPSKDLFSLSMGGSPATSALPVLQRIKESADERHACDFHKDTHISNGTSLAADVLLFVDTTWVYREVVEHVSYIIQRLNIGPYTSSLTLIAAGTGEVMVNRTNFLPEVFERWNYSTHAQYKWGFDLPVIYGSLANQVGELMELERNISSSVAPALIALLVPSPVAFVSEAQHRYCRQYFDRLNSTMPDVSFIFYAGGALIRFADFVHNPHDDLYPLDLNRPADETAELVVQRIRRVPRRLLNPRCGSNWLMGMSAGVNRQTEFLRTGGIKFYRLASNYFLGWQRLRYIQIESISPIAFQVCSSRTIQLPFRNGSDVSAGQSCGQILPSSPFLYDLSDACDETPCPPLYISVQAQDFADIYQVACGNAACQRPDEAEYRIVLNNLSCNGKGSKHAAIDGRMKLFVLTIGLLLKPWLRT